MIQLPLFLILLGFMQSEEVPFRASEDFQVELKYELKQRPSKDPNSLNYDYHKNAKAYGELPYLTVLIKILKLAPAEKRFRCEANIEGVILTKKASEGMTMKVEMGFIDDVKDHVTSSELNVYALNSDKKKINRIELKVLKNGTFLVNGETRGKF